MKLCAGVNFHIANGIPRLATLVIWHSSSGEATEAHSPARELGALRVALQGKPLQDKQRPKPSGRDASHSRPHLIW